MPTCSIPIAVQFRPTVWRHMIPSGTSWWIVPSRSMTKCAHSPGSSCSSTSGTSGANVLNAAENVGGDGDVLDDHVRVDEPVESIP